MGHEIETLAEFAAAATWEDVPAPVRHRTKLALLDIVGVILAGSLRPETDGLRQALIQSGGSGATVLAPGMPETDPRTAAMLNAIAGRSVELCDGIRGLQPSVQLVPGLLAVGQQRGSSARSFLEAYLIGYEVAARLFMGFTPRQFAHPNGQVALLACAAAGARLHGFDGPALSRAMRIATTMLMTPTYLSTAAGATALNLPAGMSGVATVLAPSLATAGFEARDDAIEDALGRMVGAGFDATRILPGLGAGWQIMDGYFRFYACCNPIHPALDALADALAVLRPAPGDIDRIEAETHAFASVMANRAPPNYFASKYSFPHAAAVLAVRGGVGFAEIDDSALTDPAIAALRQRVSLIEDKAMSAQVPERRPARVTVMLKDGRTASARRDMSRRDSERPDPEPDIRSKFALLAGTVLTEDGVAAVEAAVDRADEPGSVDDLVGVVQRYARADRPGATG